MYNAYEYGSHDVGPGWKGLVEPLVRRCKREGIEIHQIKEKFGGLRFYIASYPEHSTIDAAITDAEHLAEITCENCGAPGTQRGGGWIKTLCDECNTPKEKTE